MPGYIQPLSDKFPVVNKEGKPTQYFVEWAQQRQEDITSSVSLQEVQEMFADRDVDTTDGLQGGGNLSSDLTLSLTDTAVIVLVTLAANVSSPIVPGVPPPPPPAAGMSTTPVIRPFWSTVI